MHIKQAKIHGERELRLHHVAIWRESTLFTPRERAALAWTEAVTQLSAQGVPDEIYERVCTQYSEKELSDLTFLVGAINTWNRLNVAFRTVPGSSDKAFGLDKAGLECLTMAKPAMAAGDVSVKPLLTEPLPEYPGKEVQMIVVEYGPGGADPVHRHDAHGFIYVLEGSIVTAHGAERAHVTLHCHCKGAPAKGSYQKI